MSFYKTCEDTKKTLSFLYNVIFFYFNYFFCDFLMFVNIIHIIS